jgi:hypothetical protein
LGLEAHALPAILPQPHANNQGVVTQTICRKEIIIIKF